MRFNLTYAYLLIFITLAICLGGCVHTEGPLNLEPEISVSEATDITRTEATLSAEITERGEGKLSYLLFRYGEISDSENHTAEIRNPSDIVSVRISGLKPGTRYRFSAEGGRGNARIESQQLSFTTISNDRPHVSALEIFSSGPTAVVVGFDITEDGGEDITLAGCYVKDNTKDMEVRHCIDLAESQSGKIRMVLTSLTPLASYSITPFACNPIGETRGEEVVFMTGNTVRLSSPGELPEILGMNDFRIPSISISGKMNGTDFRFLRHLLNAPLLSGEEPLSGTLNAVDLSDVTIVEGGESYDGSNYIIDNIISSGLFANCRNLTDIALPYSTIQLQRDAFAGCDNLKSLTITPDISALLPSSDCISLERINVSEGNPYFKSIDGVLFNFSVSEILWFPQGKKGGFRLPESVTEIKENAFRGTGITSLILPSSLKTIARGAFSGSSLHEISLPALLSNVAEAMFQDCLSLTTVRFGSEVLFFGNYVFDNCPLENIYIESQLPPYVSEDTFTNNTGLFKTCTLHVPQASKELYRNHQQWGNFDNIVGIEP